MSDYIAEKQLTPVRTAWVIPLTFGRARIIVGAPDSQFIDDSW